MINIATLIVPADEGETTKITEESNTDSSNVNDKKGDSKGSGKAEGDSTDDKEGSGVTSVSGSDADAKNKQDGEGIKRLVLFTKWFTVIINDQPDTTLVCVTSLVLPIAL